jgi:hypothetical protein
MLLLGIPTVANAGARLDVDGENLGTRKIQVMQGYW